MFRSRTSSISPASSHYSWWGYRMSKKKRERIFELESSRNHRSEVEENAAVDLRNDSNIEWCNIQADVNIGPRSLTTIIQPSSITYPTSLHLFTGLSPWPSPRYGISSRWPLVAAKGQKPSWLANLCYADHPDNFRSPGSNLPSDEHSKKWRWDQEAMFCGQCTITLASFLGGIINLT